MRTRTVMLLFGCLLFAALALPPAAFAEPPAFGTHAEAAAIIDVTSGRILYSKQGDKPMRIASLTKVMTAIVAIESGNLADLVTVGRNAAGKEGSSLYLKEGEKISLKHLLYGLMLRSGNDAATAVAEHVGGSVEGFAYLMNEKARMLGMEHSHFMNPSGLDEEGHVSTANDMAKLTAYALKNPVFQEIVKTKTIRVPHPSEAGDYVWANKNKMLHIYEGADGVKTGYTKSAGRCLISSATRNGQQIAVVTLNDPNDWSDHARALDYAFRYFPLVPLAGKGDTVEGTNLVVGAGFRYPLSEEERAQVEKKVVLAPPSSLSYRLGERGRLNIMLKGDSIASLPLFEAGSPRLQQPETEPSFRFTESKPYASPLRMGAYISGLMRLVRALFAF